jgi:two-component system chemotaxis response regulator CheY
MSLTENQERKPPRARMPRIDILIVDDDPDIREALSQALEVEGYRVSTALNGRDAWEKLHSGPAPSLILLDLMMPIMNGAEFLVALRADAAFRDLPVVLVSAFDSVAAAHAHQSQCHLAKPVDLDTLIETVARFCAPQPIRRGPGAA